MKKRFAFLNIFSLVLFVFMLGSMNAQAVTVDYSALGNFQTSALVSGGITVTGSANINVSQFSGLGIVGGLNSSYIDSGGPEYISFLFDAPAIDVGYTVREARDTNGNSTYGESVLEAFDSAYNSLGSTLLNGEGLQNVSALFGGVPISRFTVTSNVDALIISQVDYNPAPLPGAVWLLGSGLAGLVAVRRKK